MAVPTKNPEYEKLKEDAKELIAAGGCFAIQYWMHTYALEICPEKYNTLEKQLEAPIYTDEWVKTGKKAVELIQKGIDILEKKTSTPSPSTVKEEESQDNLPVTHETFVVGFNEESQVVFFKSYKYLMQKNESQSDLKWVQDNCHHWEIGAASEWLLIHEDSTHEIIIPHP